MASEQIHWFPCGQGKTCRLDVKDTLSALPETRTVILQTVELANGDTCVIPAAPYL